MDTTTATRTASEKYNTRYNNSVYLAATRGRKSSGQRGDPGSAGRKSARFCNALLNEASAICGYPGFTRTNRKWGKEALAFLALFEG